jgi:hypothetical protein
MAAPIGTVATAPSIQDYLIFDLDNPHTLPFIDLLPTLILGMSKIDKYNFLTIQDIIDISPPGGAFNPDPGNPDHIKTMCTIYRYVMVRLYCFFQSSALGLGGARNGAPITLPEHIIFTSSGSGLRISRTEFFKSINDYFILRMDLDRMGKPGQVISRRNTIPPGFYNVLLNNVKSPVYKPYGRHILGNIIKNFQSGNVVTGAMGPSTDYVFACTQRDHIDVYEDYIYNCINLISNVEYNAGKQIYSFGIGYILSPGNTGCAVNVCAFIGIFTLAMILYILREHSNFFTSSNGTNESMLLNTHSLLNTCNMISGPTGRNFATTNNMYLYKFTLNTSNETQRAVGIGGSGQPGVAPLSGTSGTIPFQPYSPADPRLQLNPTFLEPVIDEIKQLAGQTVQKQIDLWNSSGGSGPFTSIIKVLGRFLPKYDPIQNRIPEYKHLWGHCYGIYIHMIKHTGNPFLDALLLKYGISSVNANADPYVNTIGNYYFLISIAEPYFSRGLISYEPTFIQPNKFKVPYLQLNSPYVNNFLTPISISNSPDCDSLYLPIKLLDTLTLRTLLDLQFYSDCRCYTSIEFQFVLNKPTTLKYDIVNANPGRTIAIVSYTDLRKVHSSCGDKSSLVIQSEYLTPAQINIRKHEENVITENNKIKATKHWRKAYDFVRTQSLVKQWKNYTYDKKQFPETLEELQKNVNETTPYLIIEEKKLMGELHLLNNPEQFPIPSTVDALDFIMSMVGSFIEKFKDVTGFLTTACGSGHLLKSHELLSIDDTEGFYDYTQETIGGSIKKKMKGGAYDVTDVETFVKEYNTVSVNSGKVNLFQYMYSISNNPKIFLLLQRYNHNLYYEEEIQIDDSSYTASYDTLFYFDRIMSYYRLSNSYNSEEYTPEVEEYTPEVEQRKLNAISNMTPDQLQSDLQTLYLETVGKELFASQEISVNIQSKPKRFDPTSPQDIQMLNMIRLTNHLCYLAVNGIDIKKITDVLGVTDALSNPEDYNKMLLDAIISKKEKPAFNSFIGEAQQFVNRSLSRTPYYNPTKTPEITFDIKKEEVSQKLMKYLFYMALEKNTNLDAINGLYGFTDTLQEVKKNEKIAIDANNYAKVAAEHATTTADAAAAARAAAAEADVVAAAANAAAVDANSKGVYANSFVGSDHHNDASIIFHQAEDTYKRAQAAYTDANYRATTANAAADAAAAAANEATIHAAAAAAAAAEADADVVIRYENAKNIIFEKVNSLSEGEIEILKNMLDGKKNEELTELLKDGLGNLGNLTYDIPRITSFDDTQILTAEQSIDNSEDQQLYQLTQLTQSLYDILLQDKSVDKELGLEQNTSYNIKLEILEAIKNHTVEDVKRKIKEVLIRSLSPEQIIRLKEIIRDPSQLHIQLRSTRPRPQTKLANISRLGQGLGPEKTTGIGPRGGTRRKHHNKRKTIKRKKNRKTYKKRLHKNKRRRTHKG